MALPIGLVNLLHVSFQVLRRRRRRIPRLLRPFVFAVERKFERRCADSVPSFADALPGILRIRRLRL
jgi:hypothetical protein